MMGEYELADLSEKQLVRIEKKAGDVSSLMWKTRDAGLIRLGDMDDWHLRNTALMLMGMGYQTYHASDELKIRWLTALRLEWERRMKDRVCV